ncbi:hypothetical protein E2562_015915 [Oryza meyeriana var. granulata]|uniref:Uncharacterized protein n=1 Tax=Oryza meyeriana var. granulata TaxID=110450 RepID=A0A6G1CFJ4_9ORYZ|nr:hypothetical protein E2562_015915 [Oryza meyeriana var. granulata]
MGQANSAPQTHGNNPRALRDMLRAAGRGCPPANYRDIVLEDVLVRGGAVLLSRLAELGAKTPACVYFGKVPRGQANLALGRLSLARGSSNRHITEAFTDGELDHLIDGDYDGLEVPVFDSEGRRYDFRCGYSEYTRCYRLVGAEECRRFTTNNNAVRDVAVGKDMHEGFHLSLAGAAAR